MPTHKHDLVTVGQIGKTFGIHGWSKIISYTDPIANILHYLPWRIRHRGVWQEIGVESYKQQGQGIIVKLSVCDSPEQAQEYVGDDIAIPRNILPKLSEDEFYWIDLEGMRVINTQGIELGTVDYLFNPGSKVVMVVKGNQERLIPFIHDQVVRNVDYQEKTITVDWDADF